MTLTTTLEKHKGFFLFPVFVLVYDIKHRELVIEFGLIKHTFTIKIK